MDDVNVEEQLTDDVEGPDNDVEVENVDAG